MSNFSNLKYFKNTIILLVLIVSFYLPSIYIKRVEAGITVETISPSMQVSVGTPITFQVRGVDSTGVSYLVNDSASQSTISNSNINNFGFFSWTPQVQDIGVHNLTITSIELSGFRNTVTVSLNILPASSVMIKNISSSSVFPDTAVTFGVAALGYINSTFTVSDSFYGGTFSNSNISGSGEVSWVPKKRDVGVHNLAIRVSGQGGRSDTVYQNVTVNGIRIDQVSGAEMYSLSGVSSVSENQAGENIAKATVRQGSSFTFTVKTYGMGYVSYRVGDTFPRNTIDNSLSISSNTFSWRPQAQDVGLHTLTITATDSNGNSTNTDFQIHVLANSTDVISQNSTTIANKVSSSKNTTSVAKSDTQSSTQKATTVSTVGSKKYQFKSILKVGSKGEEVKELQKILKDEGYLSSPITGTFGQLTKNALIKYQKAKKIKTTPSTAGTVGLKTRTALNKNN